MQIRRLPLRTFRWLSRFACLPVRRGHALLLPLSVLLVACEPEPDDVLGVKTQEITGGMRDRGDPNVVLLLSWNSSNPVGTLGTCTAEVVAPNVLLTAAHCLQSNRQNYAAYLGDDGKDLGTPIDASKANVKAQLHMAKEVHAHPQYVTTQGYYDVGVVILQNNLTGIAPLPIYRTKPSASVLSNVSIVGYGKTHDRDTSFAVTKYRADGLSATLDATHTMTVGDAVRHACVGDSGGPVLADINGVSTIIGTDSYSDETGDATRCRIASHYQRVDTYLSFLDRYVPPAQPGNPGGIGGMGDAGTDAGPDGSVQGADAGRDAGGSSDAGWDASANEDAGGIGGTPGAGGTGGTVADAGGVDSGAQIAGDSGAAIGTTDWERDPGADDDGCTISRRTRPRPGAGAFALLVLGVSLAWRRGDRPSSRPPKR